MKTTHVTCKQKFLIFKEKNKKYYFKLLPTAKLTIEIHDKLGTARM